MPADENQSDDEIRYPVADRMFSDCAEVVGIEHVESVLSGAPSHSGAINWSFTLVLSPVAKPT